MRQTLFERGLYNEAKYGAYYTDKEHAARLGQMFELAGDTCLLEPSIGDGSAVHAFADQVKRAGKEGSDLYFYGVELNPVTFENVKDRLHFCLNEDFLKGVRISAKSFSLCFCNPPYGTCNEDRDRLELEFVKKIYSYMKIGGYLVLIVPYQALEDAAFSREFLARFERIAMYRFDEGEYKKYHQYALIAKRRPSVGVQVSELEEFRNSVKKDAFEPLPKLGEFYEERFLVPESKNEEVVLFTSLEFDYEKGARNVVSSTAFWHLEQIFVKEYSTMDVGQPPLPLKTDLLYLCSIAGAGEGIAGSEEDGDLHLQRGTVTVEEFSSFSTDEASQRMTEHVTTKSVVSINVIDNDGHIIELK